jgi:hypothetical protein
MPTEPREVTGRRRPGRRGNDGRLELPLFCLALGGITWAASWIGGHPVAGLFSFLVMAGFGAIFVVGRRSESLRMMARGAAPMSAGARSTCVPPPSPGWR